MLLAVCTRSVPQKSVSDLQLIHGTSPWHRSLKAMIHICLVTKQTSMLAVTVNLHPPKNGLWKSSTSFVGSAVATLQNTSHCMAARNEIAAVMSLYTNRIRHFAGEQASCEPQHLWQTDHDLSSWYHCVHTHKLGMLCMLQACTGDNTTPVCGLLCTSVA